MGKIIFRPEYGLRFAGTLPTLTRFICSFDAAVGDIKNGYEDRNQE
ncbi:MAG: hypothetical protein AAF827_13455 [Cyanobacteria bacterium P01_D01_bin.6]